MKKILLPLLALPLLIAANAPGDFPDLEDGWKNQPEVISVATVKQVLTGMSRHQVYHVLGEPLSAKGCARAPGTIFLICAPMENRLARHASFNWFTKKAASSPPPGKRRAAPTQPNRINGVGPKWCHLGFLGHRH